MSMSSHDGEKEDWNESDESDTDELGSAEDDNRICRRRQAVRSAQSYSESTRVQPQPVCAPEILRISRRPVYLQSGGSVFSPKYLSGTGVSSDPISILHIYYIYKYQSRAGVSSQKKEVVGGRCVTNGKEETQLRSDDLSS